MDNNNTFGNEEESQQTVELESMNDQTPIYTSPSSYFDPVAYRLHRDEVVQSLTKMINATLKEAKDRIKQTPEVPDLSPEPRRPLRTTTLVGQATVVFVIPQELELSVEDIDKLLLENEIPELSLSERIDGWILERRKRANSRFDLFFNHEKSRNKFRSMPEVIHFILYNSCPGAKKNQPADSHVGQPSGSGTKRKKLEPVRRKQPHTRPVGNNLTINDASKDDQNNLDEAVEVVTVHDRDETDTEDECMKTGSEFKWRRMANETDNSETGSR